MGLIFKLGKEIILFNSDDGHLIYFCAMMSVLTLPMPDCIIAKFRAKLKRIDHYNVKDMKFAESQ